MVKLIFLDSRFWIELAKVHYGKEKDGKKNQAYKKIKEVSDSGECIFPFSMFHLEDLIKNSNKESRDRLVDFIVDISKRHVLRPWNLFSKYEIENAMMHRLGGKSLYNIEKDVIGQGIVNLTGNTLEVKHPDKEIQKILDEKKEEMEKEANSAEFMKKFLKDEKFHKHVKKGRDDYVKFAAQMETNRKQNKGKKKEELYALSATLYFDQVIFAHLEKFLQELKISPKSLNLNSKDDVEAFLEDMPSLNIVMKLTFARDSESYEREVQPNDLLDISHIAGSLPYFDIVLMEKMFTSLTKKMKLDKKYSCLVFSSLEELIESNTI